MTTPWKTERTRTLPKTLAIQERRQTTIVTALIVSDPAKKIPNFMRILYVLVEFAALLLKAGPWFAIIKRLALLAQLAEQLTLNQRVEGSSPSGGTTGDAGAIEAIPLIPFCLLGHGGRHESPDHDDLQGVVHDEAGNQRVTEDDEHLRPRQRRQAR